MSDDKSPKCRPWAPPPMDPFPTYQSHFPRSNKDDDKNPFIEFRRFADEQVSSLFSGFPQFLGLSSPSPADTGEGWKQEVETMMRQRQEWEEGFRKQFEQEMEEMKQQVEKSKGEAWKSMEDAWRQHTKPEEKVQAVVATPWWTRGNAAKCPALNGQEPQKNATKCPALYDEGGQPRTELDAYEPLEAFRTKNAEQGKVLQALAKRALASEKPQKPASETPQKPDKSWLPVLGWDGKQQEKLSSQSTSSDKEPVKSEKTVGRPTTYSLFAARRMSPFDNADETIPWLMLSPYSPIYLCNPAQSRLVRVKIQDSQGAPLQISRARFFERYYTGVDEKMATTKPWADAFEDLLSLQQTGKLVDRENWNTWRTPSTWIHDMVSRGSLGARWGFDDQGILVKKAVSMKAKMDTPTTIEDRCSRWRENRERRRNKAPEPISAVAELPAEEPARVTDRVTDRVADALAPFPLFGSIISAADAIVSAVDEAAQAQAQVGSPVAALVAQPEATVAPIEDPASSLSSYSGSSSSSASYDYNSSTSDATSVVSTLTTTVTRTLPNGAVETKRVVKRRFSNGSEESDERVEVQNPLPNKEARNAQLNTGASSTGPEETQPRDRPKEQKLHELETPFVSQKFPKRAPVVREDKLRRPKTAAQTQATTEPDQQPGNSRRGSGWFWH